MKRGILVAVALAAVAAAIFAGTSGYRALGNFSKEFRGTAPKNRWVMFERYFDAVGPARLASVLEREYPLCHSEAHDLGKIIFARTGDLTESIVTCGNACSGGCFHGVLMQAFAADPAKKNGGADEHVYLEGIKERITDICDDPTVNAIHKKGKCVHGIGHALARLADYDIGKAFPYCELFGNATLEQYCAGGVFMEYEAERGSADANARALHYPCDTFTEFPFACYPHKAPYLLRNLDSRAAVRDECLRLEGEREAACFHGLGFLYNIEVEKEPRLLREICLDGTREDQYGCLRGALVKLSEVNNAKALAACGSIDGERKTMCEDIVSRGAYPLDAD